MAEKNCKYNGADCLLSEGVLRTSLSAWAHEVPIVYPEFSKIATSRLPSDCSRTFVEAFGARPPSLNLILLHAVPLKAGTVYNRMVLFLPCVHPLLRR